MTDHWLELAFCAALRDDAQLGGVGFFTGLDDETHQLPAVTVVARSESLAGSAEVFRSEVEIRVETHAHDTPPQEHAVLVGRIRQKLASKDSLLAALNTGAAVRVLGCSVDGSDQDTRDEKFVTTLKLKAGCRVPPN